MPKSPGLQRLLIPIFLLAILLPAAAQLPGDLKITNFDGSTGFYSRIVRDILRDSRGFLWLGTTDGLYRYDGYTFRNYRRQAGDSTGIPSNNINRLAEGADHKIWIGHAKGYVSCFDPATGIFRTYPLRYQGKPMDAGISMILPDRDNRVWIGINRKGLWQLDAASGKIEPQEKILDSQGWIKDKELIKTNTISAAVEAKNGGLWLATHYGLFFFDTQSKTIQPLRDKALDLSVFRSDDFISVIADGDLLWLGSWAGGLTRYNTVTHTWKNYKINQKETEKYTTNIVSSVSLRNSGSLWISSNDRGLGIFDKEKEKFSFYSDDPQHRNDIPASLCFKAEPDKYGNIWLIHEWGLTRIQPRENQFHYTYVPVSKTDNKEFYYLRDRLEDDDNIYISTQLADGLQVINKKTGIQKHFPVKTMRDQENFQVMFHLLKDSRGKIWVVTRDYIYQYDKSKQKLEMIPQPEPESKGSGWYQSIAEGRDGHIWITSAGHGLYEYDPEKGTYRNHVHDPSNTSSIHSNRITAVTTDAKGRVWAGGPGGGLSYYDPQTKKFSSYTFRKTGTAEDAGNVIITLFTDRSGNVWAGTDDGLISIDAKKNEPVVAKVFTVQEGLRGDAVYAIVQDAYGNIWVTTSTSLCMINTRTGRISSIVLQKDVIRSIAANTYVTATANKVHVLTHSGYYSFDPATFHQAQQDSVITITSFRVRDREYYYEKELSTKGKLSLGANDNLFSFEFAVLDYSQSDDRQYTYMLEGFDKSWINSGNRRYVSYTNIPAGDYVFRVKALNAYGDTKSGVVSIPVHVDGPFYKAWWFLLILFAVAGGALYFFYRFKLAKQEEILSLQTKAQALEKEKTLVQYENLKQHLNPHFLFNSLTSLSSLIRIDQKMAGEFLDGMSRIYRYILQSKDNETVLLKEEIRFIQTFVNLQKTRFADGLEVHINVPEEYLHYKIVPVTLQNLIENAIKHNIVDSETPLVIDIYTEQEYLVVRNNMQKKSFVDTSNKQGLDNLLSLYRYLSGLPMQIREDEHYFTVKIPLL